MNLANLMSEPDQARRTSRRSLFAQARDHSVYLAFVALAVFNLIVTPGFSNPLAARSLLFQAAPIVLIALGQNLAIATRGIDLSGVR